MTIMLYNNATISVISLELKSFFSSRARYTPVTKLNSTRLTSLTVDCCRNWQQIGNKVECCRTRSTFCRCGRLRCHCVRGHSHTVDFVDFQQSRPCWIQLSPVCIPGLTVTILLQRFLVTGGDFYPRLSSVLLDYFKNFNGYTHVIDGARFNGVVRYNIWRKLIPEVERISGSIANPAYLCTCWHLLRFDSAQSHSVIWKIQTESLYHSLLFSIHDIVIISGLAAILIFSTGHFAA